MSQSRHPHRRHDQQNWDITLIYAGYVPVPAIIEASGVPARHRPDLAGVGVLLR
jgi:hypothetical protein